LEVARDLFPPNPWNRGRPAQSCQGSPKKIADGTISTYHPSYEFTKNVTMNDQPQDSASIAAEIKSTEMKLRELRDEIDEIGGPAAHRLRERLEALIIEEAALKRNAGESHISPERRAQIERLLHHIEREEDDLAHEADFLHQSPPSSVSVAAEAGARLYSLAARGLKKILAGHHPLGESVFVNHTHDDLVAQHHLEDTDDSQG